MRKTSRPRIAGSGSVADNLAARLDGARGDALYARVLFLFLGTPGALLAALLTLAVTASGGARRRQEQALLRTRGASSPQLLRLAGFEALGVGMAGIIFGFLLAFAASWALSRHNLVDSCRCRCLACRLGSSRLFTGNSCSHATGVAGRCAVKRSLQLEQL